MATLSFASRAGKPPPTAWSFASGFTLELPFQNEFALLRSLALWRGSEAEPEVAHAESLDIVTAARKNATHIEHMSFDTQRATCASRILIPRRARARPRQLVAAHTPKDARRPTDSRR